MQKAFFLVSVTTGCVGDLEAALKEDKRVQGVWKVVSGEYGIIVLVASGELGDLQEELDSLIDFKEWLGELSKEYHNEETEEFVNKKFVHKASFNLISSNSGPDFANLTDPTNFSSPRREAIK